ncbi:MAG: hypothetical protein WDZ72_14020, partial [Cyclobacteriaceae bacterium]
NPYLQEQQGYRSKKEVKDYRDYHEAFVAGIQQTIEEIFDSSQHFDQTGDLEKCRLCPFAPICSR